MHIAYRTEKLSFLFLISILRPSFILFFSFFILIVCFCLFFVLFDYLIDIYYIKQPKLAITELDKRTFLVRNKNNANPGLLLVNDSFLVPCSIQHLYLTKKTSWRVG